MSKSELSTTNFKDGTMGALKLHSFTNPHDLMRDHWIAQSNELIEAHHRLPNNIARKLINKLVSFVHPLDTGFLRYKFTPKQLAILLGYAEDGLELSGKFFQNIKDAVDSIKKNPIQIPKKKKNHYQIFPWLSYVEYDGYEYTFELSPELHSRLIGLVDEFKEVRGNYTQFLCGHTFTLKNTYAYRIYELLAARKTFKNEYGKWVTLVIQLAELKRKIAVPIGEYLKFSHFNTAVLLVSEKEINEKTDIIYKWKPLKKGRRVVAIEFEILSVRMPPTRKELKTAIIQPIKRKKRN